MCVPNQSHHSLKQLITHRHTHPFLHSQRFLLVSFHVFENKNIPWLFWAMVVGHFKQKLRDQQAANCGEKICTEGFFPLDSIQTIQEDVIFPWGAHGMSVIFSFSSGKTERGWNRRLFFCCKLTSLPTHAVEFECTCNVFAVKLMK